MTSDNRTTISTEIFNQTPTNTTKIKPSVSSSKKPLKPLSLRPTKSVKKNSSFRPTRAGK